MHYNSYFLDITNVTCIAFIDLCYNPTNCPTLLLRLLKRMIFNSYFIKLTIKGSKKEKYNKVRGEKNTAKTKQRQGKGKKYITLHACL